MVKIVLVKATADHFGAARLPPDHMPAGATRLQKKLNFFLKIACKIVVFVLE